MKSVKSLLYRKGAKTVWSAALGGVILVAAAAVGLADVSQGGKRLATRNLASMVEGNTYKDWVIGPVSYIISPKERQAFGKLTTDEERDMFIQQFWERRNPSPGSSTNAFKEEFNRRVNFADAHFSSGYPGWMSDRGHMYIDYGPPDEIHFLPHATPHPYADWLYAYIPGLGEHLTFRFVVQAGNDEYHLSSPPWK